MDKQDLINIEREVNNLKRIKDSYVAEKISKQLESTQIKETLKNQPLLKRPDLIKEHQEIKKYLTDLELKIKQVNYEIKDKRRLMQEVGDCLNEIQNIANDGVISELILLKSKYSKFASDLTRVSSMRVMANTFALELEVIINKN